MAAGAPKRHARISLSAAGDVGARLCLRQEQPRDHELELGVTCQTEKNTRRTPPRPKLRRPEPGRGGGRRRRGRGRRLGVSSRLPLLCAAREERTRAKAEATNSLSVASCQGLVGRYRLWTQVDCAGQRLRGHGSRDMGANLWPRVGTCARTALSGGRTPNY